MLTPHLQCTAAEDLDGEAVSQGGNAEPPTVGKKRKSGEAKVAEVRGREKCPVVTVSREKQFVVIIMP